MVFIFRAPVLNRHLWQLNAVVFLRWCLICAVLFSDRFSQNFNKSYDYSQIISYPDTDMTELALKDIYTWFLNNIYLITNLTTTNIQDPISRHQQFSGSNTADPKIRQGREPRQWSGLSTKRSKEREGGYFGARASCQSLGCQMSKHPTGYCYPKLFLGKPCYLNNVVSCLILRVSSWPYPQKLDAHENTFMTQKPCESGNTFPVKLNSAMIFLTLFMAEICWAESLNTQQQISLIFLHSYLTVRPGAYVIKLYIVVSYEFS